VSARKAATVPQQRPRPKAPTAADAVPSCPHCGFTGHPDGSSSPYIWCGGDEARHTRAPVSAPDGPQ
jgi:hypothetical protein